MKKATRNQTKYHNRKLVLNIIYSNNDLCRADIAKITDLTRTTVSDVVGKLIDEGLVEEIGQGQSSGGKPPTLLKLNEKACNIIGLDLASSEFRGAIIDLRGKIQHRVSFPIKDIRGLEALTLIYEMIDQLFEFSEKPILGIGIGSPGIMDAKEGVVCISVNLDWKNLPLAEILRERHNIPVYIANDCQVSALAENVFGTNGNAKNLILVKIGQGVGAGIVLNQMPYYGDGFAAGEIGHVKVDHDGELCSCGNRGCLETRISSRAIRKKAARSAKENPYSLLNQINPNLEDLSTSDIVAAFNMGDPYIKQLIQEVGIDLAKALAFLVSTLNVHRIVLAGSVSAFEDGLVEPIQEYLKNSVLSAIYQDVDIVTSSLGENIVMLGAAAMTMQNELGIL